MYFDGILLEYPWFEYLKTPDIYKLNLEATLLTDIIRLHGDLSQLNQDYLDWTCCKILLSESNDLRNALLECWEGGSFQTIITHHLLQKRMVRPLQGSSVHYGGRFTTIHGNVNNYNILPAEDGAKHTKWLCKFDYRPIYKEIFSKRVNGTGDWFLTRVPVQSWLENHEPAILWCPGIPGVGKTVISSVVINHLERQGLPICFVYMNYKRQADQSISHILGSILRQLYENEEVATRLIQDFCNANNRDSEPGETKLLALLRTVAQELGRVYVVIDALDEFLENYSDEAIKCFKERITVPHLKVMITSRVIGGMQHIFDTADTAKCEINSTTNDMEVYISSRIKRDIPFATRISNLIVAKVVEAAGERFLLAELHMNSLTCLLSIGQVRKALGTLANEIDPAYKQVLARIHEQELHRRELAMRALMWVTCAHRTLSIWELQHALAIEPELDDEFEDYLVSADTISSSCAGLIVVDRDNHYEVRLIHYTAQEFLKKVRDIEFQSADMQITLSSLTYMQYRRNDVETESFSHFYDLLAYIIDNFQRHIQACEKQLFRDISSVESLCKTLHDTLSPVWRWFARSQPADLPLPPQPFASGFGNWKIEHDNVALLEALTLDLPFLLSLCLDSGVDPNILVGDQRHTPLTVAAWCGAYRCVQVLLEREDILANWSTRGDLTALSLSVIHGYEHISLSLLERPDTDANHRVLDGATPLMLAASRDNIGILRRLMEFEGIDVNARHPVDGFTAIWYAVSDRQVEAVKLLLSDARVDRGPMSTEDETTTLLSYAIEIGHTPIIRLLLKHDQPDLEHRNEGRTLLSYAAQNGLVWLAAELIQSDPENVDLPDDVGRTPLSYAQNVEIIDLLLATGRVDVNSRDHAGCTPLMHSVTSGWHGYAIATHHNDPHILAKRLLDTGCVEPDLRDSFGRSPLSYAAEFSGNSVQLLLETRAVDINSSDEHGRTPLSYAAERNPGLDALQCLLQQNGIEKSKSDSSGRSPLFYASNAAHTGREYLLCDTCSSERRFNMDGSNSNPNSGITHVHTRIQAGGDTANPEEYIPLLVRAMEYDTWDVIQLVKVNGANPNAKDPYGRTALSYLAEHPLTRFSTLLRCINAMDILLEQGADINEQDKDGLTPLNYACAEEIAIFLIMRGGVRTDEPE